MRIEVIRHLIKSGKFNCPELAGRLDRAATPFVLDYVARQREDTYRVESKASSSAAPTIRRAASASAWITRMSGHRVAIAGTASHWCMWVMLASEISSTWSTVCNTRW